MGLGLARPQLGDLAGAAEGTGWAEGIGAIAPPAEARAAIRPSDGICDTCLDVGGESAPAPWKHDGLGQRDGWGELLGGRGRGLRTAEGGGRGGHRRKDALRNGLPAGPRFDCVKKGIE